MIVNCLACQLKTALPNLPNLGRFSYQPKPAHRAIQPACRDVRPVDRNLPCIHILFSNTQHTIARKTT